MNDLARVTHPAIYRYSRGEISARDAAELMGGDTTVHDVIYQLGEAGLPLPRRPREIELAELAKARKIFGMTP